MIDSPLFSIVELPGDHHTKTDVFRERVRYGGRNLREIGRGSGNREKGEVARRRERSRPRR